MAQRSSDRVHYSSEGCSIAHGGAAKLSKVQRSSVGCSLIQWKNIRPWRPEFGPEGIHFVSGNSLFFYFGGSSEAAMDRWGREAPRWAWQWAQKDGCAQRTGAHARPKPTSITYVLLKSSNLKGNKMTPQVLTTFFYCLKLVDICQMKRIIKIFLNLWIYIFWGS